MASLDTAQLVALAGALGWASGLRLYLVVLLTGVAGFMGWVSLPQGLQLLSNPVVLGASGVMVICRPAPSRGFAYRCAKSQPSPCGLGGHCSLFGFCGCVDFFCTVGG